MKIINLTKNFTDGDINKYLKALIKKYLDSYIDIIEVKVYEERDYLRFELKVQDDSNKIIPETNEEIIRRYTLYKAL